VDGKVALLTGASSGIGAAMAREFARRGFGVALCARRLPELEALAASVGPGALAIRTDVTKPGDAEAAVAAALARFGRLDVVVANAGFGVVGRVEDLSLEDFRRQFETNVFGVLDTVKTSLAALKSSRGVLALMGSVAGHVALPGLAPYSMSKFAVRALADTLRRELRPAGVGVVLLSPGHVATGFRQVDNRGRRHPDALEPLPARYLMTADEAARKMVRAILARRRELVLTLHGRLGVALSKLAPSLLDAAAARGLKGRPEPR
jgi:short-subunit dehydrogenase